MKKSTEQRSIRHDLGPELIRRASELPIVGNEIEKSLDSRAEWMVKESGVAEFLAPKIQYKDKLAGEVEKGVTVLSVGSGKGHELNEMDMQLPGSTILAVDPHDYWTGPVEREITELAHDVRYLPKNVSAESLVGVEDKSVDGATLFFVLHHVGKDAHGKLMKELGRVLKDDGYIFIAEDLVNSEEERKTAERMDRRLNLEIANDSPHNYASTEQWEKFFDGFGFEMVRDNEVKPDKVRHGFFVLQRKS